MIYGADKAFCPLGQHRLSACYQCGACSRDYWGLEREEEEKKKKNLGDATSPPSLPALFHRLQNAPPLPDTNSATQLSRNNVRVETLPEGKAGREPGREPGRLRLVPLFLLLTDQTALEATEAARPQTRFSTCWRVKSVDFLVFFCHNVGETETIRHSCCVIHFRKQRNVRGCPRDTRGEE